MSEPRPHLSLPRAAERRYRRPKQKFPPPKVPLRDQRSHGTRLLAELNVALAESARARRSGVGANAAVDIAPTAGVDPVRLARGARAHVDSARSTAVLFFEDPSADTFTRKLTAYSEPALNTRGGRPSNNALVAPIDRVRRPTLADLVDSWDIEASTPTSRRRIWVELWTPGGRLGKAAMKDSIEIAVRNFVVAAGFTAPVERFAATEHDIYLVHLSLSAIVRIPEELPPVTSIREASQARLERIAREAVSLAIDTGSIQPPEEDASCVAVLDSGIIEAHPLLTKALIEPGVSVFGGSAQDQYPGGHGTGMAGAAAYGSLAVDLTNGGPIKPRCWISNVRLWSNSGNDQGLWANRTREAVLLGEAAGRATIHLLCLSSGRRPDARQTSWSFAVDELAYNTGEGRLIFVAAGNVSPEADPAAYPDLNHASELHDPAQAINAISVGGITELDAVNASRAALVPVARSGELSPVTTTGITGDFPIKPDLVFEAGNACPDRALPNIGLEELSVLTTSARLTAGRQLESDHGTSIATAALAGLASEVTNRNPTRRPETIRALLVNSAEWPSALRSQLGTRQELLRCAGYGIPRRERAIASATDRPTLVHEGRIAPYSAAKRQLDELHLMRLPLPDEELLALGEASVSLAVTLSFFVEPNESFDATARAGAWLQWDMQRPAEPESDFLARVNDRDRDQGRTLARRRDWDWEIGPRARRRGSVQADRLTVDAAALSGERLLAVYPVGGWWRNHLRRRAGREVPYSLVVTIDATGHDIDLYGLVKARLPVDISLDTG